ncbi:hypothetical protein [Thiothrix subterranea]|uniref:hypothetical protein n=1 Tax=Thiothrix subterranea TaxID=2735563 RepID=UPI00280A50F8|nr:hypothetical protein [Thiothrix subterranea]
MHTPSATVEDVLALVPQVLGLPIPQPVYQTRLNPDAVTACMLARMEREKILLRVKLAELVKEHKEETPPDLPFSGEEEERKEVAPPEFEMREVQEGQGMELVLDDKPIAPPEDVKQLLTSIMLDWGDVPPEFLVPCGGWGIRSVLVPKRRKRH